MEESSTYDKKSLLTFAAEPARWDWAKIAKHCVAFANARGGTLVFGIEDAASDAPPAQIIPPHLADRLRKGVSQRCVNVAVDAAIETLFAHPDMAPLLDDVTAITFQRQFVIDHLPLCSPLFRNYWSHVITPAWNQLRDVRRMMHYTDANTNP